MWLRVGGAAALVLAAHACPAQTAGVNRDALRQIVQDQCAVHWRAQRNASPCVRIELPDAPRERDGYAVLADRKGGAHFLLIPTRTLSGIESPELLSAGAPNYFAAAWRARDLVAAAVGHAVGRGAIGLALNPRHARSQNQLHIHIECLRTDIAKVLRASARRLGADWTPLELDGLEYLAERAMGEDLSGSNPITLLAKRPEALRNIGDYTLVVAGMEFDEGPGFIFLADKGPAGELLLDSTCAIAALK